jgi:hypothetical protein
MGGVVRQAYVVREVYKIRYYILSYKKVLDNKETNKTIKKIIKRFYINKYLDILLIYI